MMTHQRRGSTMRLLAPLGFVGLLGIAACDDGTGPGNGLTAEEVAGFYAVCELRFVPEGAQPTVDIRAAAFETEREGVTVPRLALDVSPQTFEMDFVPKGQFSDRELRGNYELGVDQLTLRPNATGVARESLILPDRIVLDFQAAPRVLTLESSTSYDVARAEYARLAGVPETGLAERIPGRLTARFRSPNCS